MLWRPHPDLARCYLRILAGFSASFVSQASLWILRSVWISPKFPCNTKETFVLWNFVGVWCLARGLYPVTYIHLLSCAGRIGNTCCCHTPEGGHGWGGKMPWLNSGDLGVSTCPVTVGSPCLIPTTVGKRWNDRGLVWTQFSQPQHWHLETSNSLLWGCPVHHRTFGILFSTY